MTDTTRTTFALSRTARRSRRQPISTLMTMAVNRPELISLAAGFVDYDTLPAAETGELLATILGDPARARPALQYGTTQGLAPLREALLEHLADLDSLPPEALGNPDDVIVSTGSQELLYLLTQVLLDPGDVVLTGWPSYFVYTGTLEAAGAEVRCVDMDDEGILPEALDDRLADLDRQGLLGRVKMVYLVTYHQNPTGITLGEDRKPAVLDIVRRYSQRAGHRILLLEDAAYRELTYEGRPPRSLRSFDPDGEHVAVLQTFSKPFCPGLKTGYGLLPTDLVAPVLLQKGNIDFGSTNLAQHLLLEAMRSGSCARHVQTLRAAYALKRDAMLAALDEHLGNFHPADTHWTRPAGGLYVFLTLPGHVDTTDAGPLFQRCIDEGVLYVPGDYCFGPDPDRTKPASTMRLSFGVANVEAINEGIARLARALHAIDD